MNILMKSTLIIVVIFLSTSFCLTQTVFRGNIVNRSGEPVAGIIAMQVKSSSVIAGYTSCDS